MLNVSGHRLGTAEIESALVLHPEIAEAAVVGFDHKIKGQGIYAFVTLMKDSIYSDELEKSLVGDTTTLAEPAVIDSLKDNRKFID